MLNHWFNAKIIAAIPIFIAVNIAAILVWLFDISAQSMPLVLGIIAGGLVDLDNRLTGRLKNIFYTMLAFSVSSLLVQFTINQGLLFMLAMAGLTFTSTMLGALGQRYSTIAFGTLVVALYNSLTYFPEQPWFLNSLMILSGTLLYSLIAILVHLLFPNRPVQESVAKSFQALADYLDAKSLFFDPDDVDCLSQNQLQLAMKNSLLINAFNLARVGLFYRIRGQHRHLRTRRMIRYYFAAQDIHERANSSHVDYQILAERLKNTDLIFRIQRLLELQAQACRDLAQSLQQNKDYHYNPRLERAILGINQSFEHYAQGQAQQGKTLLHIKTLLDNLQGVDWQLRQLDLELSQENQNEINESARIATENITGLKNIWLAIRSHFTFESQLFRHAVRLSIVVSTCCLIINFVEIERGYWILLTCIFVCQPNYSATKLRLKQRILGTLLGVLIGSLLPYMASTLEAKLGIVVLSSTLFLFFRSNNYSFSTFFITIQVLTSLDIIGMDIYAAMLPRMLDTLIGATISWFAVSYLWPDWRYLQLNKVSRQAIRANARYLLHIVSQLQFGQQDNLKYRVARRQAHEYETALSTTVSNMNNEAKKYGASLQQGFKLLQLNASLLSYISALGTYRRNMRKRHQNTSFMLGFYPLAKKIIYALEHIESLEPEVFEKLQLNIELTVKQALTEQSENPDVQFSMPLQQLNMISQTLPQLYEVFQQEQERQQTQQA